MDVTTEYTTQLNTLNNERNYQRERADEWESKYKTSLNDLRREYNEDTKTTLAKFTDNLYELNRLKYNSQFYANLRNMTLGLIILALLLRLNVLSPLVAYVLGGIIAFVMVMYYWSSYNYQEFTRDGVVFNDEILKEAPEPQPHHSAPSCPSSNTLTL